MIRLRFDKGTLLLQGGVRTPYGKWDPRVGCYRAKALHYRDILTYLEESNRPYRDEVLNLPPLEHLKGTVELRGYQREGLDKWIQAGRRGIIVQPTAAGKSYIALSAIDSLKTQTMIIVPTLDLLDQWRKLALEHLGVEAGAIGGGEAEVRMITVSTYQSAYLRAAAMGNRFMLLIFDEVHHLASESYMQIAEMYVAPYRMGLTATLERVDGRHAFLSRLIGDSVQILQVDELAGDHLSPYDHEKIFVKLRPDEQEIYDRDMKVFRRHLKERNIALRSVEDFHRFIMSTGRDHSARKALLARNRAIKTALNSESKIDALEKLLRVHREKKILIFTLHNDLVYRISRRFLIPSITYRTPRAERREILANFREGTYRTVVTSQVLDEGVDVPDASVGIVLSGTGSTREYIQRLGRLLRKVEGKTAKLVEIVSKETVEVRLSQRRRRKGRKRIIEGAHAPK